MKWEEKGRRQGRVGKEDIHDFNEVGRGGEAKGRKRKGKEKGRNGRQKNEKK